MWTRLCLLPQAGLVEVLELGQQVPQQNPILQIVQVVQMKLLTLHLMFQVLLVD
mgnify:CR=1 FL=1